jgi:hypothetical protein
MTSFICSSVFGKFVNFWVVIINLYTIQARGWLIITMKDNKTIEIVFLKHESRTISMISFVSESQSQNMSILGRSLPQFLE